MKTISQPIEDKRERVTILSKKDLQFSYYCGPGHGGQAKNKVASGVMIRHEESGAIGRAHDSRSQEQNKQEAFKRLIADPRMKFFLAKKVYEVKRGEALERTVEKETAPEYLKQEIMVDGKWTEVPDSYFGTEMAIRE